jgi:phage gpG-like protein
VGKGMVGADAIRIEGLRELSRGLKLVEDGLQKEIGSVFKRAAEKVASAARRAINSRSGRLAGSLKPFGTQRKAGVRMGGGRIRYAGPYEFGGYPGNRPYIATGRAIYPTFKSMVPAVQRDVAEELQGLIRKAGL